MDKITFKSTEWRDSWALQMAGNIECGSAVNYAVPNKAILKTKAIIFTYLQIVAVQVQLLQAPQLGEDRVADLPQIIVRQIQLLQISQPLEHVLGQDVHHILVHLQFAQIDQITEHVIVQCGDIVLGQYQLVQGGQIAERVAIDRHDLIVLQVDGAQLQVIGERILIDNLDFAADQWDVMQFGEIAERKIGYLPNAGILNGDRVQVALILDDVGGEVAHEAVARNRQDDVLDVRMRTEGAPGRIRARQVLVQHQAIDIVDNALAGIECAVAV